LLIRRSMFTKMYGVLFRVHSREANLLAAQCGKFIKDWRIRKGLKQEELANKAGVSRAVLSGLEQEKRKAVQCDTIDRLLAALEVAPSFDQAGRDSLRKVARLEQEIRLRQQRERHLRLAIELVGDESAAAAAKVAKAKERVELWRKNRSCSPYYIERWSQLLAQEPRKIAKEMCSLGEWQDAMFQNSPWSWAWT
jgi:transcriptional regulator with XRE-family HTH domain